MRIITNDFGLIKLGNKLVPGIYQSMSVNGSIKVDKVEIEGQSGSSKQPLGYNEPDITLSLKLPTDEESDCYDKVEELAGIFQKTDANAKPYIYNVVNKLTAAWGINEVIFDSLKTKDSNKDNAIIAELHFIEYKPVLVEKESRANLSGSQSTDEEAFAESNEGNSSNNLPESPAVDDDEV
jgi:hypothetical protein